MVRPTSMFYSDKSALTCMFLFLHVAWCAFAQTDEGCASYTVTHVYGSKGLSSHNGNNGAECCQKGDSGRPGKVGPPGLAQKGEKGNFGMTTRVRNYWTSRVTGCRCYFDSSSSDCACCYGGGCVCSLANRNECVPCGRGDLCGRTELPRSCEFIDAEKSGDYLISPNPNEVQPFYVYCNFSRGQGVTVVRHNSALEQQADNCEADQCAVHSIGYNAAIAQIAALTEVSSSCRQFVRYRCIGGVLFRGGNSFSAWTSRDNIDQHYWGGTNVTHRCACGETGSCIEPQRFCNCDDNLPTEKIDEGYLTDKTKLPVTVVKFGDLGGSNEFGFYTIGFLECSGRS